MSSTDRTRGQPLLTRVASRRLELQAGLDRLAPGDRVREDIEAALHELAAILPDGTAAVPPVVGVQLSKWLERHKHLDERPPPSA